MLVWVRHRPTRRSTRRRCARSTRSNRTSSRQRRQSSRRPFGPSCAQHFLGSSRVNSVVHASWRTHVPVVPVPCIFHRQLCFLLMGLAVRRKLRRHARTHKTQSMCNDAAAVNSPYARNNSVGKTPLHTHSKSRSICKKTRGMAPRRRQYLTLPRDCW